MGKSLIGIQAAVGLCAHGHVALNSLEMSEREIHARVIAQTAKVPLGRLEGTGDGAEPLTEADWARIAAATRGWLCPRQDTAAPPEASR